MHNHSVQHELMLRVLSVPAAGGDSASMELMETYGGINEANYQVVD